MFVHNLALIPDAVMMSQSRRRSGFRPRYHWGTCSASPSLWKYFAG